MIFIIMTTAFHEPGEMPHSLGDPEKEGFIDNFRQWCKYGEGRQRELQQKKTK